MLPDMGRTNTHGELLVRAREGDEGAWDSLVERMDPIIWSVVRSFRIDHATAKDVAQTVWMKVIENVDRIDDPDRLPGWISTTARREAMAVVRKGQKTVPTDFRYDLEDVGQTVEETVIDLEDYDTVREAFTTLRQSDQELLRLLVLDPPLSYQEISELTGLPVGSLGPTRARALRRLEQAMEERSAA